MGRSRSRNRGEKTRRKPRKKSNPSSAQEDSDSGDVPAWAKEEENAADGDMPLEARVALLEVENATLKAENKELRKKLVEALRRSGSAVAKEAPRKRETSPEASSRKRGASSPARPPRQREPENAKPPEAAVEEGKNAVLLANDQMEAYNMSIPNNIPVEKRNPMVKEKLDRFLENFDEKVQIIDFKTDKAIIKDRKTFTMRYTCVFRESGAKLKGTCHKRFYYDAMCRPTYVLDFETHESLVTAQPGTRPDGSLGVRDPRTEHLIVLYEEKGGKITRMWLKPDSEKIGLDPTAGEETLERTEVVKAFEAKISELRGNSAGEKAGPRIFQNYHHIPSVG